MLDWVAAVLELTGSWQVGNKKILGFYLYLMCSVAWTIVALTSEPKLYGLIVCVIFGTIVNLRNIRKWKHESKQ